MKVLVCGAGGFIGRHIVQQLRAPDTACRRAALREMDYGRDLQAETWLPRVKGIDAVINAVGVLRDSRARPMNAVHHLAPAALFEACAQAGVRRVIHVSALGIDGNPHPVCAQQARRGSRAAPVACAGPSVADHPASQHRVRPRWRQYAAVHAARAPAMAAASRRGTARKSAAGRCQ